MDNEIVITFSGTHQAMKAEDILKKSNIELELIPTPRKISSECGFALLVVDCEIDHLYSVCNSSGIKYDTIYLVKLNNGEKYYEKSN